MGSYIVFRIFGDGQEEHGTAGGRIWGLGFGIWGLGFGVWGLVFGVWGLGFGVWGLGHVFRPDQHIDDKDREGEEVSVKQAAAEGPAAAVTQCLNRNVV